MAPRDQIIAQEFQDIQADQTIYEQLKIAATELKNPAIQRLQDTDNLNAITNGTGNHKYSFNRVCLPGGSKLFHRFNRTPHGGTKCHPWFQHEGH